MKNEHCITFRLKESHQKELKFFLTSKSVDRFDRVHEIQKEDRQEDRQTTGWTK